ncbi:MAG: class IV adenylate cyclase [Aggregatilineales bacterium]
MADNTLSEVEIKLYVTDLESVARKISNAGGELIAPRVFEKNVRYENAEQTLSQRGIVVRLRQDSRARLTYKEPPAEVTDDGLSHRYEAEVDVSDFDTMELILSKLGYTPHLIYEKYRTTYQLGDVEIVLDEMPYGHFVELEGVPDAIFAALDTLGLSDAPRYKTNYVQLFQHIRRHLRLTFTDITFENFNGIDVPQRALDAPDDNTNNG